MGVYTENFASICGELYCKDPSNPSSCNAVVAEEGTQCGNKTWCVDGACTFDTNAPTVDENCVFGDKKGEVFSGMSCANIPGFMCSIVPDCCASCAPPRTTSFSPTTTPTARLLKTATITFKLGKYDHKIFTNCDKTYSNVNTHKKQIVNSNENHYEKLASLTKKTLLTKPLTGPQSITLSQAHFTTTNATGTFKNSKHKDTTLIAVGSAVAVMISLILIFIVVCRKKLWKTKVKDIEAKKPSSRRTRVK